MAELAAIGRTLREATDYYLAAFRRPPSPTGNILADKVLAEYKRRAEAKEISDRQEESMQETVTKFRHFFGATPIDKITAG
jgi:hypothetical protein